MDTTITEYGNWVKRPAWVVAHLVLSDGRHKLGDDTVGRLACGPLVVLDLHLTGVDKFGDRVARCVVCTVALDADG